MKGLIDASLGRGRTVVMILVLVLIGGTSMYVSIPKEGNPDIDIPIIYTLISHEGISPEDAERLLIRPMEQELRTLEGVKEMRSSAFEGGASVTLEFDAGFDADQAILDVRDRVDTAKAELPAESEEPTVHEVNVALFPILNIALSGDLPERALVTFARELQDDLEGIAGVLEVEIAGDREEMVEITVDPILLTSYNLSETDLFQYVARNNQLVAAGTLDSGSGRFPIKVPGVFENVEDVLNLPIKVSEDRVVRFRDVATVRRAFKDASSIARVDGQPALVLEVKKRVGANIIDTVDQAKAMVEDHRAVWPAGLEVGYQYDESKFVRTMLGDLQNSVLTAVLLVAIVIVGVLGLRTAGLVGVAIPGSFLMGILILGLSGMTVNMVVLFSLIMAVGLLVDGAIVVTEFADRKMSEGMPRRLAYRAAAKRMAWPIIASTATTLAAFMPLLFWPGTTGEFMKYLPLTLIFTLTASLVMALIFVPTLGGFIGKPGAVDERQRRNLALAEDGDLNEIDGFTGWYLRRLAPLVGHPWRVFVAATLILIGVFLLYGLFGKGTEYFPDVEPEKAALKVHARGDLSLQERDALVREVERHVVGMSELESVYTVVETGGGDDVIGTLQLNFTDLKERERLADEVLDEIRRKAAEIAGVQIEIQKEAAGPGGDQKPIQLQVSSQLPELSLAAVERIRGRMEKLGGFQDLVDTRPLPGIEWQVRVDRPQAARYGADVALVGSFVQMVTNGIKLGEYRPDDTDDEIDIRVRFPVDARNLNALDELRVRTPGGQVPISQFVQIVPAQKVETIKRVDGRRAYTISASGEVREGEVFANDNALNNHRIAEMRELLPTLEIDPRVDLEFKGQDEEQRESGAFLQGAFMVALFVMAIILVTQFNSFLQAGLILTAVVFSVGGVLLGLLIMGQPFGIVMSGVGVISLAGIVVNNNIVLIDTYNVLRRSGMSIREAILRTAAQRLRPVMLTTVTTILGLLPMVLSVNIDLFKREIIVGGQSMQWWSQLATAVAGGLAFATVLTLVLTPCLLSLQKEKGEARQPPRERLRVFRKALNTASGGR